MAPPGVNKEAILAFKQISNEERLIADTLNGFNKFTFDPIIDVGSGTGLIAALAWPSRNVLLVDMEEYPAPTDQMHTRVRANFFHEDWSEGRSAGTLVFSHSLQYLDENMPLLNRRIAELAPRTVLSVTDVREGFYGELVAWAECTLPNINPEHAHYTFAGYEVVETVRFHSTIAAHDMMTLAQLMVGALLDHIVAPNEMETCVDFFQTHLKGPDVRLAQIAQVHRCAEL